jgi:hypothetical protein
MVFRPGAVGPTTGVGSEDGSREGERQNCHNNEESPEDDREGWGAGGADLGYEKPGTPTENERDGSSDQDKALRYTVLFTHAD